MRSCPPAQRVRPDAWEPSSVCTRILTTNASRPGAPSLALQLKDIASFWLWQRMATMVKCQPISLQVRPLWNVDAKKHWHQRPHSEFIESSGSGTKTVE